MANESVHRLITNYPYINESSKNTAHRTYRVTTVVTILAYQTKLR